MDCKTVESRIGVKCLICGSVVQLDEQEEAYARHFGTTVSIHICKECKRAIEWAKEQMTK